MAPEPRGTGETVRRRAQRSALLIDWGGVLTTNLFASFHAYCLSAGIEPADAAGALQQRPEARELLIALEKGELEEADFELQLRGAARGRARRA